jgi:hypothetical protein
LSHPPTLPPADDRLYGPDSFGALWLVVAVLALALAAMGLAWALWPARRPRIVAGDAPVLAIRDRYLSQLDELQRRFEADELVPRMLHHELSRTLRRFAVELGTVRAAAMSAGALDGAGQRAVASAVRRYEHPQFEQRSSGDPHLALTIARDVITNSPTSTADGVTE